MNRFDPAAGLSWRVIKFASLAACAVLAAALLSGCTEQSLVVDGSTVTIASSQATTSLNDRTTFGNTPANAAVVAAAGSGFTYYNADRELVRDESFGEFEIVSNEPFSVRYTVNEGVSWSDGVAVDAADLLLAWAANSGVFTTEGFEPARFIDRETGQFTEFPDDTVYFDGATRSGLQHVSEVPELGDDGRSITLTYDEYFPDWELALVVGPAAHVVVEQARTVRGTEAEPRHAKAKRLLIEAVKDAEASSLAPIATAWNSAFNVVDGSLDDELLVTNGPYAVTAIDADAVTLTANARYTGERKPRFETVVIRTITDPLEAVAALREGEVDVIAPTPTVDIVDALEKLDDVEVTIGESGQFEHLDLQFERAKSGALGDPLVREAFLRLVPRQQILDELVLPVAPDARLRESFLVAPGAAGYDEVIEGSGVEDFARTDVRAAKRLLAKADVASPVVCILFDPANPRRVAEFALIKESVAEAGLQVTDCSRPDWQEFLGVTGVYDAALFAWNETTAAVTSPAARLASGSTTSNFSHYANDDVDQLLAELAVATGERERTRLLAEIETVLWEDSYGVPLYQFPSLVAVRGGIQNVTPSPLAPGLTWNLWEWEPASATT